MLSRLIAIAAVSLLAAQAIAHEFWIQPATFHPLVGENVGIRLLVGDGFPGESRPRDPTKLERFVVAGTIGSMPIPGRDGQDPAGIHRFERTGVQVLGYRSKETRLELPAEKFDPYLKSVGLDSVIATRAKRGQSQEPGRELFSRCSKSLVCVGETDDKDTGYATELNLPLEIVPDENPYLKKPGDTLRLKVLRDHAPAAGLQVSVFRDATGKEHATLKTDQSGIVTITLDAAGVFLINCVSMSDAPKDSGAEWQSLWASLTFEVQAPKPAIDGN